MSPDEVRLLRDILDRFAAAVPAEHDPEADALVRAAVRTHPDMPLAMARYLIVLERALRLASGRVVALEGAVARPAGGGGFLGAIFGSGRHEPGGGGGGRVRAGGTLHRGDADASARDGGVSAGAFLTGAAALAMGIAGEGLIADAIGDLMASENGGVGADGDGGDDVVARDHGFDDGSGDDVGSGGESDGGGDGGGADGGGE